MISDKFKLNFNFITNLLLLFVIFFGGFVWADTNGVWHNAEDVRGGIFGNDEQDVTASSGFIFRNQVILQNDFLLTSTNFNNCTGKLYTDVMGKVLCGIDDVNDADADPSNEKPLSGVGIIVSDRVVNVNTSFVATLDSLGKVPISQLPFHKGDMISPANRPLISGQPGYDLYYFDITNLDIVGTNANKVAVGTSFGLNNVFTGTYTSDATAVSSNIISGKTAYVNGVKITGALSLSSVCSSAGGTANCDVCSPVGGADFISFNSGSGSWTVPNGVTKIEVILVGGGGGGGAVLSCGQICDSSTGACGSSFCSTASDAGFGGTTSFGSYSALGGGAGGTSSVPTQVTGDYWYAPGGKGGGDNGGFGVPGMSGCSLLQTPVAGSISCSISGVIKYGGGGGGTACSSTSATSVYSGPIPNGAGGGSYSKDYGLGGMGTSGGISGGGGGELVTFIQFVTPGSSISYVVGVGGAGGSIRSNGPIPDMQRDGLPGKSGYIRINFLG